MSLQDPTVYNLEYFSDAPFWEGVEAPQRRTLLMPLPSPKEFLAFGVYGPADTVHFVARGRVREHLGNFLSRMDQAGASVELYQRVPLPWPLVRRYINDDSFEGSETDRPKGPIYAGSIGYAGGAADVSLWETSVTLSISENPTWPSTPDSSTRRVFILPLNNNLEFLAMGACTPPDLSQHRFVFVARGETAVHREDFITRMRQAVGEDNVKFISQPLPNDLPWYLKDYINDTFPQAFAQSSMPPPTGEDTTSTSKWLNA